MFFWTEDRKRPLADRVAALEDIVFQQDLGDYAAKTRRVRRLVGQLAGMAGLGAKQRQELDRAALLSRADLVTGLVGEFPELQGVVGGLLARADGEPELAADAIHGLYAPGAPDGPLPASDGALILGAADRLDTLAGAFAVGLAPSGSKDPFALRRAGYVLVRLAWRLRWLDLARAAGWALEGYAGGDSGPDLRGRESAVAPRLLDFLFERFSAAAGRWISGVRYDEINAVRSFARDTFFAGDLFERVLGLQEFRTSADFYALALASKRVRNILAQAAERGESFRAGEGAEALVLPEELALANELKKTAPLVTERQKRHEYAAAYSQLAKLRPAVDLFFDKVLVMDENPTIRRARLGLLAELHAQTHGIVDMSEIVVEGSERGSV
jgi:glycyl-tRNA synthetase beta chain